MEISNHQEWLRTHCYACGQGHAPDVQAIYDEHRDDDDARYRALEALEFVTEPGGCELCGRSPKGEPS